MKQSDIDRNTYSALRKKTGCPPVNVSLLYEDTYFAETSCGRIINEQVSARNAWEAKALAVLQWAGEEDI